MPRNTPMICPYCFNEYTLGVNGVYDGCDTCRGITRNSQGMIVYGLPSEDALIKRMYQGPILQQEEEQS
jgi:hypothetical protein